MHIGSKEDSSVVINGLSTPNGIAYNEDNILVTDTHNKLILKYEAESLFNQTESK